MARGASAVRCEARHRRIDARHEVRHAHTRTHAERATVRNQQREKPRMNVVRVVVHHFSSAEGTRPAASWLFGAFFGAFWKPELGRGETQGKCFC